MSERLENNSPETSSNPSEKSRWDSLIEFGKTHIFRGRTEKMQPTEPAQTEKPKDELLAELRQRATEAYSKPAIDESDKIQAKTLEHIGQDVEKIQGQTEVERELNRRLITIDKLETELTNGNPGVERLKDLEFGDKRIPVYNLKGLPFAMLNHTVDYRRATYETGDKGSQTSQELLENPSLWARSQAEAMQDTRYSNEFRPDAIGNVISTSYIDSKTNFNRDVDFGGNSTCQYGFNHVNDGDLLDIIEQDGATSNTADYHHLHDPTAKWRKLNDSSVKPGQYNELVIRRYSEKGQPKLPDYMITKDGRISEDTLRHASYFNIPIVNLDTKAYEKQADDAAINALETISENSSYSELASAIEKIASTYKYNKDITLLNNFGRGDSEKFFKGAELRRTHAAALASYPEIVPTKLLQLEKLEHEKRPDFIISELRQATEACKNATLEGKKYDFQSENLSSLEVTVYSPENGTKIDENGNKNMDVLDYNNHARYNEIMISMSPKNTARLIETNIIDGEQYRNAGNDNLDNRDAQLYHTMLPQVQAYLAARQENASK